MPRKSNYRSSAVCNKPECYICHRQGIELDHHHLLEGRWRKLADQDNLWVWMCRKCHSLIHNEPSQTKIKELQKLGQETFITAEIKKGFSREIARDIWFQRYGKFFD